MNYEKFMKRIKERGEERQTTKYPNGYTILYFPRTILLVINDGTMIVKEIVMNEKGLIQFYLHGGSIVFYNINDIKTIV